MNKQVGYIELFYDASTHVYLGYRESNKNYVLVKKENSRYLKINYSIKSKILYMGFSSFYIENKTNDDKIMQKKIEDELMHRLDKLKKAIVYIQRILNNIRHSRDQKKEQQNTFMSRFIDNIDDPIKKLTDKYKKDLKHINIKIFNDYKKYLESIFYQNNYNEMNIDKKSNYIDVMELSKEDTTGNLLLCYIVKELLKFIEINGSEKFIIEFVFEILSTLFEYFNIDRYLSDYEIKRFTYLLQTKGYLVDTEKRGAVEGIYQEDMTEEELTNEKRRKELDDTEEAENALDIDRDDDMRGDDEESLRDFANIGDRD